MPPNLRLLLLGVTPLLCYPVEKLPTGAQLITKYSVLRSSYALLNSTMFDYPVKCCSITISLAFSISFVATSFLLEIALHAYFNLVAFSVAIVKQFKGLQMLHNILKRYRTEFNKTPILRKLLKVLEYLALREILTIDHINGVPS